MAWYKNPEWRHCLETFDDWWFWATEYTNEDGDLETPQLWALTDELVDSLLDVAGLDPMPVWDVYRFIDNRHSEKRRQQLGQPASNRVWDTVSIPEISDRLQQVMMLRERCRRVGIMDVRPDSENADTLKVEPRFKTPPCPKCGGKAKTASSGKEGSRVRQLKCADKTCAHTWKLVKST